MLTVTLEELEATRGAQRDMFAALKARKEVLEEALRKKTEELKAICIKEGVSSLNSAIISFHKLRFESLNIKIIMHHKYCT